MFNINTCTADYMSVVVTHECNRRCKFCIDQYRGSGEFISSDNVLSAIDVAKENNIKDILIVGGEPTLHPDIKWICKQFKDNGFRVIMTTNYDFPMKVKEMLSENVIDCLNISNYNQKLPVAGELVGDVTIHTLLRKGGIDSVEKLDFEIDRLEKTGYHLKFSTLSPCNEFAKNNQVFDFLNNLNCEYVILFNEILGQVYRNAVIKRYDHVVNNNAKQSIKFHVDGKYSSSWERT